MLPYSSVTSPPVVATYSPSSRIRPTNRACAPLTAPETRSWTWGEASARSATSVASCLTAAPAGAASAWAGGGSCSSIVPWTSTAA